MTENDVLAKIEAAKEQVAKRLDLSHNQLQLLPESIWSLTHLESLKLQGQLLERLPDSIGNLTGLKKLDLAYNRLSSLPESIGRLDQLVELNLGSNRLESLPESIGGLTQLKTLEAAGNRLQSLLDSIGNLIQLTHIALDGNQLRTLPESIGNLTKLKRILLRVNQLETLPDSIRNLLQLERILLSINRLRALPDSLFNLPVLASIEVNGNQLESLPENIGNLTTLESLDVSNNRLQALPESICELKQVSTLNFSNNHLQFLPKNFGQIKGRKLNLNLSNNPSLTSLPDGIKVVYLDISGCNLKQLPDTLQVWRRLDIGDTGLQALPPRFQTGSLEWRGVEIDERIAFHPETITAEEVIEEINVERRRVLLERMGHERFMQEAQPEILDVDEDKGGERWLLRIDLTNDEPLVCLNVADPSTGRKYMLRVPPTMTSCQQAAAWIAGFNNPADYRPIIET
jgi:Leucine-rich repeat (LRR) protein